EILGGGVHDNVRAQVQRVLQVRRHGARVHAKQRAVIVSQNRQSPNVNDAQQRVGRALHEDQARFGRYLPGKTPWIAGVGIADADAGVVQNGGKEPVCASIQVVAGKDFVAGGQQPGHSADGRQPTREAVGAGRVLQLGELRLQGCARGVTTARVIVAAELFRAFLFKRSSLVN